IRHGPLRRGQPGSVDVPLPGLLASGRGDDGLVRRRPLSPKEKPDDTMRIPRSAPFAALAAAALLAPAGASAQSYPKPQEPAPVAAENNGRDTHITCCQNTRT